MKWSIGKKIIAGYIVALLLLTIIGVSAYLSVRELLAAEQVQDHTREVLVDIDKIQRHLIEAESSQRGFVLTGNAEYLQHYEAALVDLAGIRAELRRLLADEPSQIAHLKRLDGLLDERIQRLAEGMKVMRDQDAAAAAAVIKTNQGILIMDQVRAITEGMSAEQLVAVRESVLQADANAARVQAVILYGTPLAGLILLGLGFALARNIARPLSVLTKAAEQIASGDPAVVLPATAERSDEVGQLTQSFRRMGAVLTEVAAVNSRIAQGDLTVSVKPQSSADSFGQAHHQMIEKLSGLVGAVQRAGLQVNTSATEIAATSKQQQATATEIAATTTEIGATSREIAATSKELVRTVGEVTRVADETAQLADNGQSGLGRMESTMRHIMDASGTISGKLAVLNEKATNINAVVTTITKVADQTNPRSPPTTSSKW